jgi:hypothetical protein
MSAPTRRTATAVWLGILATPLFFAAMVAVTAPPPEIRSPELSGMFFWMSAAVVGLGIVLSRVLPRRVGQRGLAGRDPVAFTRLAVAWAILDGAALFPLVAWLVTGDPFQFLLTGVALAALVALFPSEARWATHSVQPVEAPRNRLVR